MLQKLGYVTKLSIPQYGTLGRRSCQNPIKASNAVLTQLTLSRLDQKESWSHMYCNVLNFSAKARAATQSECNNFELWGAYNSRVLFRRASSPQF